MLAKRSTDARSTNGEDIRNEKVTPIGSPALVKPMNKGMDEQEQKGVIVPRSAASKFAVTPLNRPMIFLVLSGGKKLWIYEMPNIRNDRSKNILMVS
jgi:hypothetical protein